MRFLLPAVKKFMKTGLITACWRKLFNFGLLFLLACVGDLPAAQADQFAPRPPLATNVFGLRNGITPQSGRICAYDLEGTLLAAEVNSKVLFFQDDSGTAILELNLTGMTLRPGERVRLQGTNYVSYTDLGLSLGTRPVVDADNLHSAVERCGTIYLEAGLHPIQVSWFNQTGEFSLDVAYAGPGLAKQRIPASVLFRAAIPSKDGRLPPGLNYRCYEGQWNRIPDFDLLSPQKTGIVPYFDISIKTRDENMGLKFNGFLKVANAGNYTFYLSSDDGSQLFIDNLPPKISVLGIVPVPVTQALTVSQPLSGEQEGLWSRVEGTITFLSRYQNRVKFELTSGENRMQVEVLDAAGDIPWYLLNSRVQVAGICPDLKNAVGQKYAGLMIVANWHDVQVNAVALDQWSAFEQLTIGELKNEARPGSFGIASLHGQVQLNPNGQTMRFEDATGSVPIQLLNGFPIQTGLVVECLSRWNWAGTNLVLSEAITRDFLGKSGEQTNELPVLTTAMQVQTLTREEAERKYPVKIQGVVTAVSDYFRSLLVQDSTRAVFVWIGGNFPGDIPHLGDYCEIEGTSRPADFSPVVDLLKATVLRRGQMPLPVIPKRDQLSSGSLDAQYVEVRGLVIATGETYITLLTAEGTFKFDITPAPRQPWPSFLNSIIRVRGCLQASWDADTHIAVLDQPIRLLAATVSMESPSPTDLFKVGQMNASELLRFDARFDPLRRVKVRGQIVHSSPDMDYMMDDQTGLRFQLAKPTQLAPGDEVEVVGLVELGGASSLLRQAVARKIGHEPLPEPRQLSLNSLSNNYDSTLVSLEGTLVDYRSHGSEQRLEMQVGVKRFLARLIPGQHPASPWQVGSRLKLTGVLSALDGNQAVDHEMSSFELLLNSPADVQVLARPPWWTLSRLLVAAAFLLAGLMLAFVWISLLRRQVERRTLQLRHEIGARERTEKMRAVEEERTRIARDLHDDLGSELTEISMMATASPGLKMGSEMAASRLREIAEKSRSMISALDGVVWVVNSKNDTLSSLVEYLASNAEEFLGKAQIACRIELPKGYAERKIQSEIRHDVMLAVREAINNAVRHGQPDEVLLQQVIAGDHLEILIQDDGCGFNPALVKGNGLGNLHERMEKLNGSCQIASLPGKGTSVTLKLILPHQS